MSCVRRLSGVVNALGFGRTIFTGLLWITLIVGVGGTHGIVMYAHICRLNSYHCVGNGITAPALLRSVIAERSRFPDHGGVKLTLLICTSCVVPSCNLMVVRNGCVIWFPSLSYISYPVGAMAHGIIISEPTLYTSCLISAIGLVKSNLFVRLESS